MRKRKECLSSKASHSFSMSRLREFNEFLATAGRHHGPQGDYAVYYI